jgi:hypothetical protein
MGIVTREHAMPFLAYTGPLVLSTCPHTARKNLHRPPLGKAANGAGVVLLYYAPINATPPHLVGAYHLFLHICRT